jgi:hypothetical protein
MRRRRAPANLRAMPEWDLVGGLSLPSKMPGYSYGLPALSTCRVGTLLAQRSGSTCSRCYALRGNYRFANVRSRQRDRWHSLADLESWSQAMIALIDATREPFFRWHDSGDLISLDHLRAINSVALATPTVAHWLPTREYGAVDEFARHYGAFAPNLTVRKSAPYIGQQNWIACYPSHGAGARTSTVGSNIGYRCPSKDQGNACLDCRACWDRNVPNIDYRLH